MKENSDPQINQDTEAEFENKQNSDFTGDPLNSAWPLVEHKDRILNPQN